ncbi:hypothetical protein NQ318_003650, partial [Aromia moschata]
MLKICRPLKSAALGFSLLSLLVNPPLSDRKSSLFVVLNTPKWLCCGLKGFSINIIKTNLVSKFKFTRLMAIQKPTRWAERDAG